GQATSMWCARGPGPPRDPGRPPRPPGSRQPVAARGVVSRDGPRGWASCDALVGRDGQGLELVAEDLAGRAARDVLEGQELHVARALEAGQSLRAPGTDVGDSERRAGLQDDDGLDRFAPTLVRHADRTGLAHGGVAREG